MKQWTDIIKEVFPIAYILDSAFEYPIGDDGWRFTRESEEIYRAGTLDTWFDYDYDWGKGHMFVNLQDMVTGDELIRLDRFFRGLNYPLRYITVLCWPMDIQEQLPEDSFNVITFSSHQYETWCSYKRSEEVLREQFAHDKKTFEYSWVCPQRIYKPHRAALFGALRRYKHGNISLQSKGVELAYPSLSYSEYDRTYDNLTNLLAMKKNYNSALFSIISESQFEQQYGIITEKTFNSIVAGMPFLMCGHRGAVNQIKRLGFESYSRIFDEEYDDLDNSVRMTFMIELNDKFTRKNLSTVERQMHYDELTGVIEYNRDYFFDQFGDQLISDLRLDLLNIWNG